MLELFLEHSLIVLLFFIIAVLYSSVGFGGGSSYLAVLALSTMYFTEIRATALLCNIVVVSSNVMLYQKRKDIRWKKVIPLTTVSIPLAFLGGYLKISAQLFYILLGVTLLFAAITMWFTNKTQNSSPKKNNMSTASSAGIGGMIGLISGMVGIGGGIFLAPVLHITYWDTPKKIAAASSFFILINSLFGFAGQATNPDFRIDWNLSLLLMGTVFIGGLIGNRMSHRFFSPAQLKKATALLIAFVSLRILFKYYTGV
ncbi:MAG: hypothetical protein CMB99_12490 [Flavobacteriaceae bacterium]|nr:hypothetical protein [Flavobacteriaceae bacterium]